MKGAMLAWLGKVGVLVIGVLVITSKLVIYRRNKRTPKRKTTNQHMAFCAMQPR